MIGFCMKCNTGMKWVKVNVVIETGQLIFIFNQVTGFYMTRALAVNGLHVNSIQDGFISQSLDNFLQALI